LRQNPNLLPLKPLFATPETAGRQILFMSGIRRRVRCMGGPMAAAKVDSAARAVHFRKVWVAFTLEMPIV
jgi:hypothetical protein